MIAIDHSEAKNIYEKAHFYIKTVIIHLSTHSNFRREMYQECNKALQETESEMKYPMMKDDYFTACIRLWYNIVLFHKVFSNHDREIEAACILRQAFRMRDLHEKSFLEDSLESNEELKNAYINFKTSVLNYNTKYNDIIV